MDLPLTLTEEGEKAGANDFVVLGVDGLGAIIMGNDFKVDSTGDYESFKESRARPSF